MKQERSSKQEYFKPESEDDFYGAFDDSDKNFSENENKVRDGFWRVVSKLSKQFPQIEKIVAAYYCAFDENTPTKVRAVLLAALAYFVLPMDAVPDFLVGFGFTDDLAVLTAALSTVANSIKQEHVDAAKRKLASLDQMSD